MRLALVQPVFLFVRERVPRGGRAGGSGLDREKRPIRRSVPDLGGELWRRLLSPVAHLPGGRAGLRLTCAHMLGRPCRLVLICRSEHTREEDSSLGREMDRARVRKGLRGLGWSVHIPSASFLQPLWRATGACSRPIISVPRHGGFLERTSSPDPLCRTKQLRLPTSGTLQPFSGSSPPGWLESPTKRVQSLSEISSSRTINPGSCSQLPGFFGSRPWYFPADFAACQPIPSGCVHITQSTRQVWNSRPV